MKITLRKANALQASINEALKAVEINLSVELNEHQNAVNTVADGAKKLIDEDNRRKALLETLYTIRSIVGQANNKAGIDEKLTQIAYLSKRIDQVLSLASNSGLVTDAVVLQGKLENLKKMEANQRLYHDTVTAGVKTQEMIDNYKKELQHLKKTKLKISDEILSLNITTEIELDATSIAVLNKENLL